MARSADDFRDHTEYGGGQGTPGRKRDGSSKQLSNGEKARVIRQMGVRGDFDINADDTVGSGAALSDERVAIGGIVYAEELRAEDVRVTAFNKDTRKELDAKTNKYAEEVNTDD